ncbi:amidohydrolase/deacetylase family metallohydrolase [Chloroflexota bacterium]
MASYDLLIKNGTVIDPSQNIYSKLDIAVKGDTIAIIEKGIPENNSLKVVDAEGKIVCPGLIDLHCHVAHSIDTESVEPDTAGVYQGVTTVVDGGSTGEATFAGFPKDVIPYSQTRVFCFINVISKGLPALAKLREPQDGINLKATGATIEAYRGIIKGVKLLLTGEMVVGHGIKIVELAKTLAGQHGMPVMIHIGDREKKVSPTLTKETLSLLDSGDILSHVFTAKFGGILSSDGTVLPELKKAVERGVILDTALGENNFNFKIARSCIGQGILPTTLSSDLSAKTLKYIVYGLTVTMTKFMGLGLDLKQVIAMSTINPARALREENQIGSLKPGMKADISILEILSGQWRLEDFEQEAVEVDKLIAPRLTIRNGQAIPPQRAPQLTH